MWLTSKYYETLFYIKKYNRIKKIRNKKTIYRKLK